MQSPRKLQQKLFQSKKAPAKAVNLMPYPYICNLAQQFSKKIVLLSQKIPLKIRIKIDF